MLFCCALRVVTDAMRCATCLQHHEASRRPIDASIGIAITHAPVCVSLCHNPMCGHCRISALARRCAHARLGCASIAETDRSRSIAHAARNAWRTLCARFTRVLGAPSRRTSDLVCTGRAELSPPSLIVLDAVLNWPVHACSDNVRSESDADMLRVRTAEADTLRHRSCFRQRT